MLYFGDSRAVLGANCAAQLPPRLVPFPLLFQRGISASTQRQAGCVGCRIPPEQGMQGSGSAGVGPLPASELGGTKPCKVSWEITPEPLPKAKREFVFVSPSPSSNDQQGCLDIWEHFQTFSYAFHMFLSFPSSGTARSGSLVSLCSEENSKKCTGVAQFLAPQLTDTLPFIIISDIKEIELYISIYNSGDFLFFN